MKLSLNTLTIILVIICLFVIGSGPLAALEIGGTININNYLNYDEVDEVNDFTASWQANTELEVYLPRSDILEPRLVIQGNLNQQQADFDFKYLYLRYQQQWGHLTTGRQPVSWNYGSLINPLGYGPGIENLAGELLDQKLMGCAAFIF